MSQHQPHSSTRANREPRELGLIEQIARVFADIAQQESEEHGRRVSEGKARAKARREAEARAQAAAADQVSK